mmetsp:Transcript_15201/g.27354  ORF Transcript_15201/g.27354 Transcript_15201/m.27354 type:complete len:205 (+) Transcript_15201:247-861(+)
MFEFGKLGALRHHLLLGLFHCEVGPFDVFGAGVFTVEELGDGVAVDPSLHQHLGRQQLPRDFGKYDAAQGDFFFEVLFELVHVVRLPLEVDLPLHPRHKLRLAKRKRKQQPCPRKDNVDVDERLSQHIRMLHLHSHVPNHLPVISLEGVLGLEPCAVDLRDGPRCDGFLLQRFEDVFYVFAERCFDLPLGVLIRVARRVLTEVD